MRTLNPSLALASFVGFLAAASCTLITDVDRTKIPTDAGAEGGSPGTGGTGATGGTGGTTETGGTGGTSGTGGGGTGGEAGGGAGTSTGGGAGMGPVEPVCKQARGTITIGPMTFFADKDTFTLSDGVNPAVIFELDLDSDQGVTDGHVAVPFNGSEKQDSMASIIADVINAQHDQGTLRITAMPVLPESNNNGAAGGGGAPGAGGSTAGVGGEENANLDYPADVDLVNDLAGALGNVRIKDTVGNPNFTTVGMAGGDAAACASPASCTADDECASATCGDDHICQ